MRIEVDFLERRPGERF